MMKRPDKNQLMDQLAEHGYSLMRPKTSGGDELLAHLLQQDDARLLEGFPVVLADLMKEKKKLACEHKTWRATDQFPKKTAHRFFVMLALSYSLFHLFGMEKETKRVSRLLSQWNQEKDTEKLTELVLKSKPVRMDRLDLSTERLKQNFQNYVLHREGNGETEKKRKALEFELLLSELFTPRQRELLRKRLEHKSMTKTEKEYFYRVVRKRLKAVANEDLHQFARNLVMK